MAPRNAMVAGSWFLTREVELSNARALALEFSSRSDGTQFVRWHLPATKTDTQAMGIARTHRCICALGPRSPRCPVHALKDQWLHLQRRFPARWLDGRPDPQLPLFPTVDAGICTKEDMRATIERAATELGIPLASPDGTERVSGHSLRVTGAQGLARAGTPLWSVQLMGRWGVGGCSHISS